jgi:SPOR domain
MADESDPRAHRPNEALGGNARSGDRDSVAELARSLGYNDDFEDFGRHETRNFVSPDCQAEDSRRDAYPLPPLESEQHAAALNFDVRPYRAHPGDRSDAYQADAHAHADRDDRGIYEHGESWIERQEIYHAQARALRRRRLTAVMAVVALAAVGSAGVFGYRAMSAGSKPANPPPAIKADMEPGKIVPPIQTDEPRIAFPPPNPPNSPQSTASVANSPSLLAAPPAESVGVGTDKPKKSAAPVPARTAAAPNPPAHAASVAAGRAYVQVSSLRSETDAQASFKTLQGKYPDVLGGKRVVIRRAELGGKGVHYRAMVGPFASTEQAAELCSRLKAAGGQCVVQRN